MENMPEEELSERDKLIAIRDRFCELNKECHPMDFANVMGIGDPELCGVAGLSFSFEDEASLKKFEEAYPIDIFEGVPVYTRVGGPIRPLRAL